MAILGIKGADCELKYVYKGRGTFCEEWQLCVVEHILGEKFWGVYGWGIGSWLNGAKFF